MSLNTWTPAELSANARTLSGLCWRVVEAQYHVSTLKLTNTILEQQMLEHLVETVKPQIPPECRHLHYLLATPFRYGAIYPKGSRFRRQGMTEGVFYASETVETAVAEATFYRLLFFAESPGTPWSNNPGEYTAFAAEYGTGRGIDLTRGRFAAHRAAWSHPTEYGPTQAFAEIARSAAIELLRYRSVRDPEQGMNVALLTCTVFTNPEPITFQTWRIHLRSNGAQAICEAPKLGLGFNRGTFAADPRIAAMRWNRD
jgi:RES domain